MKFDPSIASAALDMYNERAQQLPVRRFQNDPNRIAAITQVETGAREAAETPYFTDLGQEVVSSAIQEGKQIVGGGASALKALSGSGLVTGYRNKVKLDGTPDYDQWNMVDYFHNELDNYVDLGNRAYQEQRADVAEYGGPIASTLYGFSNSAYKMAGSMAATLGVGGMIGRFIPALAAVPKGAFLQNLPHLMKIATVRALHTEGSWEDRVMAGAYTAAYSATPFASGPMANYVGKMLKMAPAAANKLAVAMDIALNVGISTGGFGLSTAAFGGGNQYVEAMQAASQNAMADGREWDSLSGIEKISYAAETVSPILLTDVLFALTTKATPSYRQMAQDVMKDPVLAPLFEKVANNPIEMRRMLNAVNGVYDREGRLDKRIKDLGIQEEYIRGQEKFSYGPWQALASKEGDIQGMSPSRMRQAMTSLRQIFSQKFSPDEANKMALDALKLPSQIDPATGISPRADFMYKNLKPDEYNSWKEQLYGIAKNKEKLAAEKIEEDRVKTAAEQILSRRKMTAAEAVSNPYVLNELKTATGKTDLYDLTENVLGLVDRADIYNAFLAKERAMINPEARANPDAAAKSEAQIAKDIEQIITNAGFTDKEDIKAWKALVFPQEVVEKPLGAARINQEYSKQAEEAKAAEDASKAQADAFKADMDKLAGVVDDTTTDAEKAIRAIQIFKAKIGKVPADVAEGIKREAFDKLGIQYDGFAVKDAEAKIRSDAAAKASYEKSERVSKATDELADSVNKELETIFAARTDGPTKNFAAKEFTSEVKRIVAEVIEKQNFEGMTKTDIGKIETTVKQRMDKEWKDAKRVNTSQQQQEAIRKAQSEQNKAKANSEIDKTVEDLKVKLAEAVTDDDPEKQTSYIKNYVEEAGKGLDATGKRKINLKVNNLLKNLGIALDGRAVNVETATEMLAERLGIKYIKPENRQREIQTSEAADNVKTINDANIESDRFESVRDDIANFLFPQLARLEGTKLLEFESRLDDVAAAKNIEELKAQLIKMVATVRGSGIGNEAVVIQGILDRILSGKPAIAFDPNAGIRAEARTTFEREIPQGISEDRLYDEAVRAVSEEYGQKAGDAIKEYVASGNSKAEALDMIAETMDAVYDIAVGRAMTIETTTPKIKDGEVGSKLKSSRGAIVEIAKKTGEEIFLKGEDGKVRPMPKNVFDQAIKAGRMNYIREAKGVGKVGMDADVLRAALTDEGRRTISIKTSSDTDLPYKPSATSAGYFNPKTGEAVVFADRVDSVEQAMRIAIGEQKHRGFYGMAEGDRQRYFERLVTGYPFERYSEQLGEALRKYAGWDGKGSALEFFNKLSQEPVKNAKGEVIGDSLKAVVFEEMLAHMKTAMPTAWNKFVRDAIGYVRKAFPSVKMTDSEVKIMVDDMFKLGAENYEVVQSLKDQYGSYDGSIRQSKKDGQASEEFKKNFSEALERFERRRIGWSNEILNEVSTKIPRRFQSGNPKAYGVLVTPDYSFVYTAPKDISIEDFYASVFFQELKIKPFNGVRSALIAGMTAANRAWGHPYHPDLIPEQARSWPEAAKVAVFVEGKTISDLGGGQLPDKFIVDTLNKWESRKPDFRKKLSLKTLDASILKTQLYSEYSKSIGLEKKIKDTMEGDAGRLTIELPLSISPALSRWILEGKHFESGLKIIDIFDPNIGSVVKYQEPLSNHPDMFESALKRLNGNKEPDKQTTYKNSFESVVAEINRFNKEQYDARNKDRFEPFEKIVPNLPEGVKQLTTKAEVQEEGEKMNHCAACYADSAKRGEALFFHIGEGDKGATLALKERQLDRGGKEWVIDSTSHFRGAYNRLPTEAERAKADEIIRIVNEQEQAAFGIREARDATAYGPPKTNSELIAEKYGTMSAALAAKRKAERGGWKGDISEFLRLPVDNPKAAEKFEPPRAAETEKLSLSMKSELDKKDYRADRRLAKIRIGNIPIGQLLDRAITKIGIGSNVATKLEAMSKQISQEYVRDITDTIHNRDKYFLEFSDKAFNKQAVEQVKKLGLNKYDYDLGKDAAGDEIRGTMADRFTMAGLAKAAHLQELLGAFKSASGGIAEKSQAVHDAISKIAGGDKDTIRDIKQVAYALFGSGKAANGDLLFNPSKPREFVFKQGIYERPYKLTAGKILELARGIGLDGEKYLNTTFKQSMDYLGQIEKQAYDRQNPEQLKLSKTFYLPMIRVLEKMTTEEKKALGDRIQDPFFIEHVENTSLRGFDRDKTGALQKRTFSEAPLRIMGIDELMMKHADDVIRYASGNEIWNKWKAALKGNQREIVQKMGEQAYRDLAQNFMEQEGVIDTSNKVFERAANWMLNRTTKIVLQNPVTWAKQYWSVFSGARAYDSQALAKGMAQLYTPEGRRIISEMRKLSPPMQRRLMANRVETDYMFNQSNYRQQFKQASKTDSWIGKASNKLSSVTAKFDRLAIDTLALAAHDYASRTKPNLTGKSLLVEAVKEWERGVHETQVSSEAGFMSPLRLSHNPISKMFGYMSGATSAAWNTIARDYNSVLRDNTPSNRKNLYTSIFSVLIQAMAVTAIGVGAKRLRKNEDEIKEGEFSAGLMNNLLSYFPTGSVTGPHIMSVIARAKGDKEQAIRLKSGRGQLPHGRFLQDLEKAVGYISDGNPEKAAPYMQRVGDFFLGINTTYWNELLKDIKED